MIWARKRLWCRLAERLALFGVLLHATLVPWTAAAMAAERSASQPELARLVICHDQAPSGDAAGVPVAPTQQKKECEHCKGVGCLKLAVLAAAAAHQSPPTQPAESAIAAPGMQLAVVSTPRNRGPPSRT